MSDRWEYKLLVEHGWRQRLRDADGVDHGRFSQEFLDRIGDDGWELCSHSFSVLSPRIIILKRRASDAGEQGSPGAPG